MKDFNTQGSPGVGEDEEICLHLGNDAEMRRRDRAGSIGIDTDRGVADLGE